MNEQAQELPQAKPAPNDHWLIRRSMALIQDRRLQLLWFAIVAAFIAVAVYKSWDSIRDYDWRHIQTTSLVLALITTIIRKLVGAFRWAWIIDWFGDEQQTISIRKSLRIFFISSLATYLPGTYWFIPGRIIMNSKLGVKSLQTGIGTVIEQFLIVASGGLTGLFGLELVANLLNIPVSSLFWLFLVVIGGLVAIHPTVLRFVTRVIGRIFRVEMFAFSVSYRRMLFLLLWSMFAWFVSGLSLLFLAQMIVPQINLQQAGIFTAVYSISFLIGYFVPFAPGGIGIREGIMGIALAALGIPAGLVIVIAALSRLLILFEDGFWSVVSIIFF
jgi:uncharacterized membrane protein YbhN (UPF0104 family)